MVAVLAQSQFSMFSSSIRKTFVDKPFCLSLSLSLSLSVYIIVFNFSYFSFTLRVRDEIYLHLNAFVYQTNFLAGRLWWLQPWQSYGSRPSALLFRCKPLLPFKVSTSNTLVVCLVTSQILLFKVFTYDDTGGATVLAVLAQ